MIPKPLDILHALDKLLLRFFIYHVLLKGKDYMALPQDLLDALNALDSTLAASSQAQQQLGTDQVQLANIQTTVDADQNTVTQTQANQVQALNQVETLLQQHYGATMPSQMADFVRKLPGGRAVHVGNKSLVSKAVARGFSAAAILAILAKYGPIAERVLEDILGGL